MTQSELKELLHYDSATGIFTWAVDRSQRVKAGMEAGSKHSYGYTVIRINGKNYTAHRLAFLYMEGEFPQQDVDHIDGVRDNNTWANLRHATRSENMQNSSMLANNATGYKGVSYDKANNKFLAQIRHSGKNIHLGRFNTAEEAAEAYVKAKIDVHPFNPVQRIQNSKPSHGTTINLDL
jgi:hypothetical protein